MKRIESIEDEMKGIATFVLDNGDRQAFDLSALRKYGLAELMKSAGLFVSQARVKVMQAGKLVGTVPWTFDPAITRTESIWYDIRPTDFKRVADGPYGERSDHLDYHWEACKSICPGDFATIPGFKFEGQPCEPLPEPDPSMSLSEAIESRINDALSLVPNPR